MAAASVAPDPVRAEWTGWGGFYGGVTTGYGGLSGAGRAAAPNLRRDGSSSISAAPDAPQAKGLAPRRFEDLPASMRSGRMSLDGR